MINVICVYWQPVDSVSPRVWTLFFQARRGTEQDEGNTLNWKVSGFPHVLEAPNLTWVFLETSRRTCKWSHVAGTKLTFDPTALCGSWVRVNVGIERDESVVPGPPPHQGRPGPSARHGSNLRPGSGLEAGVTPSHCGEWEDFQSGLIRKAESRYFCGTGTKTTRLWNDINTRWLLHKNLIEVALWFWQESSQKHGQLKI